MLYILLLISVIAETCKNICNNFFGKNILKTTADSILFNTVSGVGALLFFLFTAKDYTVSAYSFSMAIVFAAVTAAANYCSLMAVATGPMAVSSLFVYLGGMIVPAVFGVVYYGQPVSIFQIFGCVLMLVSLFLNIDLRADTGMSLKWLVFAVGSFLMWGLTGICQQIHQKSEYAHELGGFLLWSFVILSVLLLCIYIPLRRRTAEPCGYSVKNKVTVYVAAAGILIGVVYRINMYLSGKLPSIVFFPIVNGGVMLLSAVAAMMLFKEKTDIRQKIGIAVGIAAICLLGIT